MKSLCRGWLSIWSLLLLTAVTSSRWEVRRSIRWFKCLSQPRRHLLGCFFFFFFHMTYWMWRARLLLRHLSVWGQLISIDLWWVEVIKTVAPHLFHTSLSFHPSASSGAAHLLDHFLSALTAPSYSLSFFIITLLQVYLSPSPSPASHYPHTLPPEWSPSLCKLLSAHFLSSVLWICLSNVAFVSPGLLTAKVSICPITVVAEWLF